MEKCKKMRTNSKKNVKKFKQGINRLTEQTFMRKNGRKRRNEKKCDKNVKNMELNYKNEKNIRQKIRKKLKKCEKNANTF